MAMMAGRRWGFALLLAAPLFLGAHHHTADGEAPAAPMTQGRMVEIIRETAGATQGPPGFVEFVVDGVAIAAISDVAHDRMRLIAPVADATEVGPAERDRMLEANFHTTLDGRYATSGGVVFTVFTHRLSTLTAEDLRAAIDQVASLVKTFGTGYAAGDVGFRPRVREPDTEL
jgi:hypothetical protein